MRVVRSSVYRRYTSSLNDLQSNLNKSMNKVSTGAAYETAADNPLAYLPLRLIIRERKWIIYIRMQRVKVLF